MTYTTTNKIKNKRTLSIIASLSLLAGGAFVLGYWSHARAAGIPTTAAMTYSGVLTDANGVALTGQKNILVQLYDAATAGNTQCTVGPSAVTLNAGAFQIGLPDACTTAVHSNPNLWVEVFVDNASFGRSKLGAVPFAVEADTASNAAGALATKLATIPTVKMNSSGYVACQPISNFAAAGFTNLLVRARLFSDAACTDANELTYTSCHPWCAARELQSGTPAPTCCGVGPYYTNGVVDVLQWK